MRTIIDVRLLSRGGTSGIEEYTRLLVSHLLTSDQKNDYALFYNGLRKAPLPAEWRGRRAEIIDTKVPNKILDVFSRFLNFPKIEDFAGKADLVFSPHFNITATGLPRVITFHDLSFVHHPDFFLRRQRLWHWFQDCKRQAERADRIIAVSEFTKNDLANLLGISEEKIKVIYSGIDPTFKELSGNDGELLKFKSNHGLQKPFILYLGTLEPRKNVLSVVKIFNALAQTPEFKDWELVIAGNKGWLCGDVQKEAAKSVAKERVRFLERINPSDRVYLYNLAKIFIYPSFFEGFGLPPLEAQACGVPVLASDRTSLPEILGSSAVLADPWRLNDIYDGIKKIQSDGHFRENLIKLGLLNVQKFTWERAAAETLDVLYN